MLGFNWLDARWPKETKVDINLWYIYAPFVFPDIWNWTIGTISPPGWYNTPSPHYEVTVFNSSIFVQLAGFIAQP